MTSGIHTGAITNYIDVAQLVLYLFWIFFAGLLYYLHGEDKREGYPLESDRSGGRIKIEGFPRVPKPKLFRLANGGSVSAPRLEKDSRTLAARPLGGYLGAPLVPTGNPMLDGVGPAAYAERGNFPDLLTDGQPMIVPVRLAVGFGLAAGDPDPRGMVVLGADRIAGGTVTDFWVDRAEAQIRYLEVQTAADARRILLPVNFTRFDAERRRVHVKSILGSQFAQVPGTAGSDRVTRLEEDKIMAYYAGGHLYATAARSEPLL
jgi:photosynthetic reaction center H subunit